MPSFAGNVRTIVAMVAAEREIQEATNSALAAWVPLFLADLVPDGTASVAPDPSRAERTTDHFDEAAILAVALLAWRKRYKKSTKAKYSQPAEDKFAEEVLRTVRLIPRRSFQVATEALRDGFRAGLTARELLTAVTEAVRAATDTTAERTGRLIGPSAINDATLASYTQYSLDTGIQYTKSWVSMADLKVRPTHREAHADVENQNIQLHAKFRVGGELCDRPRDPDLSEDESAGCRCIAAIDLA